MNNNPKEKEKESNSNNVNVDIMSFNKERLNLINDDFNRKGQGLVNILFK